jgi:hypothetical protein
MDATQTKKILREMPFDQSIMLVAKHGVGKSSVVKQVTEELDIGFFDVRLSQCEVGDIKGLPYLDEETAQTKFFKPQWWPKDPDSSGVLFFDELNRASKDVLQAVFEICLDRRLDGEPLPDGWRVVAAINATDDYDVVELDPALLDRWFYIEFDPTKKEWMKWATQNKVHPSVVEFVAQNPEVLDPPIGNLDAGEIYPSRRSWVQFNHTATALGLWDSKDEGMLTQIASGWLGTKVAIMFPKYFLHEYAKLKASDILDNFPNVKDKVEAACVDIEVIASITRGVINELKERSTTKIKDKQRDNIKEFMQVLPKDSASQLWVQMLNIPKMKKIALKWNEDADFKKYIRSVYYNTK